MDNKDKKPQFNKNKIVSIVACFLLAFIITMGGSFLMDSVTNKEISYNQFIALLENNAVKSVEFDGNKIYIIPEQSDNAVLTRKFWTTELNDPDLISELKSKYTTVEFKGRQASASSTIISFLLEWILPLAIIWGFMLFIMRRQGSGFGVGKSKAKMYVQKDTGVTFKDVAGQDEAEESVAELVDFLHNPKKYTEIGAKLPKGGLLVGPPGTGKTLLARAVAGEAHVPFFSLSGSDFVEMFVGVGASRVRDLFKQAEENAPCIIFIDEIDSIGKSRDSRFGGGNDEREQTLNALLAEMDGFDPSKGILILAATNRPEVLDPALLRPGRFDRRIIVNTPDLKGRVETLKVHSKNVKLDESVDLEAIANITSGAVGSDLANMVNEAAINAVKNGRKAISQDDLMEAVEVVIAGKEKKDRIMSKEEKKIVAYHEVGHALVSALQKDAEPVRKITIIPRTMGSLGYVLSAPEKEKFLMTKKEMDAELVVLLAGRASEEIVFESVTTGASNDMEKATDMARSMIARYGMSDKFGLMALEKVSDPYLGANSRLNCSDKTATEIEEEVKQLLKERYEDAKKLLNENRDKLDSIASYLYEKETITGEQFMKIFKGEADVTCAAAEPTGAADDATHSSAEPEDAKASSDEELSDVKSSSDVVDEAKPDAPAEATSDAAEPASDATEDNE